MAVYFLDNDQQLIKIVPDNGAISILQTQELPEDNSLLKDLLSVHLKNDERLFDAQYMAIKRYDGNRNSFDMYRIVNEIVPDNATEFEGVQVAPYELEGVVVEDLRPQGWTIERTTNQILKDSDWRLGYVDDNLPTVTTNFYYLSAKDSLKKLQELTGVEFTFKVEISGNKITDKWVEVYRELGNRTLKRFNYGTNALTVKRETNHSELYTALIGRGKGEEVGETDAGDATYGRKINFADVEWKKSAGKPVDKPKGQKYIELPQATAEFGIKMLDGRKVPRIGMVEFSDTEDPEVLIEQTWQALQEYARPKVLFSATVANIGDTGIGDTVTIHRHDLNMHYKTRVRKVMRNRKNNDKTQVEIGDVVYTASTKRQSNINSKLNNMENDLSNVKGEVSHVVTSADGKNNITYSNTEPERKRVGDSWVRDHPSLAGETQWLVWNGEAWELILDTSETTLNKEAIEQAQADIESAREQADEAVGQIDTAVANAGFTSLDETISSVQSISNAAQANAEIARDHALDASSDADTAMTDAKSALNGIDQLESTVSDINFDIDEINGTLDLKADSQTVNAIEGTVSNLSTEVGVIAGELNAKADSSVVDTLSGIVDNHTLDIQANAEGLALKASQDTVDTLEGTVSSLGTDIGVVAGQISQKVWNTDIESAIDGIEVGGRNYLLDSDFTNGLGDFQEYSSTLSITNDGYIKDTRSITTVRSNSPNNGAALNMGVRLNYDKTIQNEKYTLSFYGKGFEEHASISVFFQNPRVLNWEVSSVELSGGWTRYSIVFTALDSSGTLYLRPNRNKDYNFEILLNAPKLEKGNKATDWTPAPEDTLARFDHIETEWTQTFDSFSQTVSSIDGRVSKQEQTVSGMQSVVYDPETGLSSLNTQLANLVQVAVTGEEMTGAISVLENNINARVEKGDVINQINISDENILIQANKIMALGDAVVDGKLTITDEFIAPNAQIDGAKIADATIGSAKIADLDVNKISGNRTEFIESWWNTAVGSSVYIGNGGVRADAANGTWEVLREGQLQFFDQNSNKTGAIGTYHKGGNSGVGIFIGDERIFSIARLGSSNTSVDNEMLTVRADRNQFFLNTEFQMHGWIYMNGNRIHDVRNLTVTSGRGGITQFSSEDNRMAIYGRYRWDLAVGARESLETQMSIRTAGIFAHSNLHMQGREIHQVGSLHFRNSDFIITRATGRHNNGVLTSTNSFYLAFGSVQNWSDRMQIHSEGVKIWRGLQMSGYNITQIGELAYLSDERLKGNIEARTENDLATIMAIDYKNYTRAGKQQRGFIAQQMQSIDSDLINVDSEGYLSYNGQGYMHTIGHALQQNTNLLIETNKLASAAYIGIEEHQETLDNHESRIEKLEKENKELKNEIEELERKIA